MFEDYQKIIDEIPGIQDKGGFADIDKLYSGSFQTPAVEGAKAGISDRADVTEQNKRVAARKEQELIKEKIAEMEQMNDPKKYQKVTNLDDGGYDFYDPMGNPISPLEYAKITGMSPLSVLKDSQRASDLDFRDDYEAILELNLAARSGPDALDKFFNVNHPELQDSRDSLTKMSNGQLMNLLIKQYPQAMKYGEQPAPEAYAQTKAGINPVQELLNLLPGTMFGTKQATSTFLNAFPLNAHGQTKDAEGKVKKEAQDYRIGNRYE